MKTTLYLIGFIVICLSWFMVLAETKISLNPFSFKMPGIWTAIGVSIMLIGLAIYVADIKTRAHSAGIKKWVGYAIEAIEETVEEYKGTNPH